MATQDQLVRLVKTYAEGSAEEYKTLVLQLAAHEEVRGHTGLAQDLRTAAEKIKPCTARPGSQSAVCDVSRARHTLSELTVPDELSSQIQRILIEYRSREALAAHGLTARRKILLGGRPGTGKSLTAAILASELNLPLCTVMLDKLAAKEEETASKLRQLFDEISAHRAVYLFDAFDALITDRSAGKAPYAFHSFLQLLEHDSSQSMIVVTTNNKALLDRSVFCRFHDVLHYDNPRKEEIRRILDAAAGLCHGEIIAAREDAAKYAMLNDGEFSEQLLLSLLAQRHGVYKKA